MVYCNFFLKTDPEYLHLSLSYSPHCSRVCLSITHVALAILAFFFKNSIPIEALFTPLMSFIFCFPSPRNFTVNLYRILKHSQFSGRLFFLATWQVHSLNLIPSLFSRIINGWIVFPVVLLSFKGIHICCNSRPASLAVRHYLCTIVPFSVVCQSTTANQPLITSSFLLFSLKTFLSGQTMSFSKLM